MHPWLLHHPPITTYGACIVAGLILAWLLARHTARRARAENLHPSHIDLLVPLITAAGLLGAYLFGLFTDQLTPSPAHGTVLWGSLLLATAAGIAYALIARIPLGLLGDIVAAPIALGIACGRAGCFFAGCCYGDVCTHPSPLTAITFPQNSFAWNDQLSRHLLSPDTALSLPVYPVQLYEAALTLLLAITLTRRFPHRKISGENFLLFGLAYSLIRFPLEYLRADNPRIALNLTFSQLLSLLVIAISLATLLLRRQLADVLKLRATLPGP